ncbi:hypothetical protein JTE90_015159 [Oedothorax gibbosus]|uniref:K Homology domain-containing protein n=1 Tax=Oedothorax gibbosus TaxID=931172 RepID=A0AAV6V8U9_9ARAC|nr:hypothetical protein JTE90_015159 [Oedothorax gibbosus]
MSRISLWLDEYKLEDISIFVWNVCLYVNMDILKTELVWVEGHCYRKLPIKDEEVVEQNVKYQKTKARIREEPIEMEYEDIDLPIKHEGDRFYITMEVPEPLVGFVQGKQGARRKQIEERTSTQIKIPPSKNKDIDCAIVIVGRNKESVASAYHSIDNICKDARWKVGQHTHFISIPMNDPSILEGFHKFKSEVLANCGAQGINESVFQPPAKLHVTIAMLTLLNNREKETALGILQKSKNEILHILGGKSLLVEIKGVEYMNDDPSEVDVLYGKIKETDKDNCLQIIADILADAFANSDFSRREKISTEEKPHVKLHVTLMKSKTSDNGVRDFFDARKIMKDFANFKFGQMTVNEIHISVRFTGGTNSYYSSTFVLKLSK